MNIKTKINGNNNTNLKLVFKHIKKIIKNGENAYINNVYIYFINVPMFLKLYFSE